MSNNKTGSLWKHDMGYLKTMQDIMEQGRREECRRKRRDIQGHPVIDDIMGLYHGKYFYPRFDEEIAGEYGTIHI